MRSPLVRSNLTFKGQCHMSLPPVAIHAGLNRDLSVHCILNCCQLKAERLDHLVLWFEILFFKCSETKAPSHGVHYRTTNYLIL